MGASFAVVVVLEACVSQLECFASFLTSEYDTVVCAHTWFLCEGAGTCTHA